MYTIQNINYKKNNTTGYTRLCLYVRSDTTGEKFKVNGNSDVGVDFYKAKTSIRFNRKHIDSGNNLIKGLIEPTDVTSLCLARAMKACGHNTESIKTMKDHFCWDTILSKKIPNITNAFDSDHWLNGLATVFPYIQGFDVDERGKYCVNDEVVGLKKFLNKIGVYYSTHDIFNIVDHMGFESREEFVKNLVPKLFDVPNLSSSKIINLVNALPESMTPPETRRFLRIYVHITDKQKLTGSIYVPVPPHNLWNDELDKFPKRFYESDTGICLVDQYDDEARFVKYIKSREREGENENKNDDAGCQLPNEKQAHAIENARIYPVSLVTGPPGSGKTFISAQIIKQLDHMNVYLLAPTGKAVYRLQELVRGMITKLCFFYTIHKFNGISNKISNPDDKHWKNAEICFDAPNLFIIDEASMLGYEHMNLLLNIWKKVTPSVIVFLGDTNQLPPIGPGDLFQDLVFSNTIPCTKLTERHRQVDGALMDAIIAVEAKRVPNRHDEIFQHICITTQIVEKACECLFSRFSYDDFRKGKVMVIASKNETVNRLSVLIRATLVPESKLPEAKKTVEFYDTDLVRCNANFYDPDMTSPVMRGTPGVIVSAWDIDKNDDMKVVTFDDNKDEKPRPIDDKNAPALELNYALTCHKAQGSEADHVVFVLEEFVCPPLHKRNLLYTAMSRAKKTLTIIGPVDVLHYMVANEPVKRLTTMQEHFEKFINPTQSQTGKGTLLNYFKIA